MANTDFSQWNPNANNQESDSSYQSDVQRTGGATTGAVFPSLTANKIMYQVSTMVRALAVMLANKGISTADGTTPFTADASSNAAVTALVAQLANLLTTSDILGSNNLAGLSGKYFIKFGPLFGGLIVQFGVFTQTSNPQNVAMALSFPNDPLALFLSSDATAVPIAGSFSSNSNFNCSTSGSAGGFIYYLAIGF